MSSHPVFFDRHGRRPRRVAWWFAGLGLALAIFTTAFIMSLFVVPLMPKVAGLSATGHRARLMPRLPDIDRRKSMFLAAKARDDLQRVITRDRKRQELQRANAKKSAEGDPVVAAFYVPWQEVGITSFKDNASKLTHVLPYWLHLDPADPSKIDFTDFDPRVNTQNTQFIEIARSYGVKIWPVLGNNHEDRFDPHIVASLLDAPEKQAQLATAIQKWLVANAFDGLNLDFENLPPRDFARLPAFLQVLRSTLHRSGLGLSIDLEAGNEDLNIAKIAENVDLVVAMAYDEHYESGAAGPIASIDWTDQVLDKFASNVPASKLVIGIGSYAYDWQRGAAGADSISYQEALKAAAGFRDDESAADVLELDPTSLNTHFTYDDDEGKAHDVWMLDGVSAYNQWKLASQLHVRGSAMWVLGQEDPSVWSVLNRSMSQNPNPGGLRSIQFGPDDLEYRGQGEILYVQGKPTTARRDIEIDKDSGLVVDETYRGYPSSFYVARRGYAGPKTLALTFDDGPDPHFTPQILDVLKENGVPATFFVIGQNAEASPDLVRRMIDDGHEVGSHTFDHPNLSEVSDERAELELNSTERVIEGITGRTTVLFRPPYNADSEPTKPEDLKPIALASRLGYVTVGESLDPQDWRLAAQEDGSGGSRSVDDIVQNVLDELQIRGHGNSVLLHDGGGDRSRTVQALKVLLPELKRQGYRFVPVSALLNTTRDAVMPPVTGQDRALIGFDRFAFGSIFAFEWTLRLAFLIAIGLGLIRVLLMIPLAILHRRRHRTLAFAGGSSYAPTVSVLIAAYNEEKVIARTIRSILASKYPPLEVIVVDDGSKDGTSERIAAEFGDHPKVIAVRQENGGKASAINHGLTLAKGEIIVSVDADTLLKDDAIGLLVRHFENPRIGAVAGNVKVGNRINVLTRWQSVEYITSQNLDREAHAYLGAISVCPGAIGAWRRVALVEAGGYLTDTLAEDMDLTWRLQRAGWTVENESRAIAYTEAPDTLKGFFGQRFRWAYGTLQCLWKHRAEMKRRSWMSWFTLPSLWLFQIVFQVLAPLVDLQLVYTAALFLIAWISRSEYSKDWRPVGDVANTLVQVGFLYGLFFVVELAAGLLAYRMDREKARSLWWLFLQRLVYRQIMYVVIYKAILTAIRGRRQGWGKLERKATVKIDETAPALETTGTS